MIPMRPLDPESPFLPDRSIGQVQHRSKPSESFAFFLVFPHRTFRYLLHPTPLAESTSPSTLNDRSAHPFADDDDAAEAQTSTASAIPDARDQKRRKPNKRDKERTGQNKARSFPVVREASAPMCRAWEQTGVCAKEGCRYAHNWSGYFAVKPHDIHYRTAAGISGKPPYVEESERAAGGEDEVGRTVDMETECPVLSDLGYCPYGWRCRFLGGHVRRFHDTKGADGGSRDRIEDWQLLGKKGEGSGSWRNRETNWPDHEVIWKLRNNSVCGPR